jgi:hypothetical protein
MRRWKKDVLAAAAVTVAAAVLSPAIAAQPAADPMEACSQKTDASARLACFDQEMKKRHTPERAVSVPEAGASTAAVPAAPVSARPIPMAPTASGSASAVASASHSDEDFGLQGDALRHRLKEEGVVKPPPPKPMTSQIIQARQSPDHRFTFTLSNGQVWEQTEVRQGFYLDPKEPVTISVAALGSYFLETPKKEYVKVRRLQ